MPQVAAYAAAKLTWAAVGKWLLTTAIVSAASYGLGRILARKPTLGGVTSASPLDLQVDSQAPRRVIYGETGVGPVLRFRHSAGTNNKYLYLIFVWASHECQAITALKVNGEVVTFDIDGNATTGPYAAKMTCSHHLGRYDQNADAIFVSQIPAFWTNDHRLRGVCYSAIRLEWDDKAYPTGLPQFTAVVKGRKVYDWRDGAQSPTDFETWQWSDNPALCTADFIRGVPMPDAAGVLFRPFGIEAPDSALPTARVIACANACDELVALAAGGTEKRYTCNGSFDSDASPPTVLDALVGSMAGKVVPVGSTINLYAGVYTAPDFTVTEDMLRGEPSCSAPLPRRERINVCKGTFSNPAANYQRDDFPPIVSNTFIAADGAELTKDLDLAFTNSGTMAQRIAKIALLRSRQGILTNWPCNLRALSAATGENVLLTSSIYGWTDKPFEVVGGTLSIQKGDDGGLGFAPDFTFQETDASIYDWTTSEEQTIDPAPNSNLPDPRVVAAPTSLVLLSDGTTAFIGADGTIVPRVKVSWTAPADQFTLSGGRILIQYKLAADGTYRDWATLLGNTTQDFITDVKSGQVVDVRIRAENVLGVPSAWVVPGAGAVTVQGDTTPPGALAAFAVAAAGPVFQITFTAPADDDVSSVEIQESIVGDFTDGVIVGTAAANKSSAGAFARGGITADYTRTFRARAVDTSLNRGPWSAGVSATASVTAGPPGTPGAPGAPGAPGLPGLDGSTTFYGPDATPPSALRIGDVWFVTDRAFEMRRATATGTGGWVSALTGSNVFEIIGGTTYIKRAAIRELDAGVILAGTVNVALSLGVLGSLNAGSGFNAFSVDGNELNFGLAKFANYGPGTQFGLRDGSGDVAGALAAGGYAALFANGLGGGSTLNKFGLLCPTVEAQTQFYSLSGGMDLGGNISVAGDLRRRVANGWTPPMYDGTNSISLKWDSGQLRVLVDASDVGYVNLL